MMERHHVKTINEFFKNEKLWTYIIDEMKSYMRENAKLKRQTLTHDGDTLMTHTLDGDE